MSGAPDPAGTRTLGDDGLLGDADGRASMSRVRRLAVRALRWFAGGSDATGLLVVPPPPPRRSPHAPGRGLPGRSSARQHLTRAGSTTSDRAADCASRARRLPQKHRRQHRRRWRPWHPPPRRHPSRQRPSARPTGRVRPTRAGPGRRSPAGTGRHHAAPARPAEPVPEEPPPVIEALQPPPPPEPPPAFVPAEAPPPPAGGAGSGRGTPGRPGAGAGTHPAAHAHASTHRRHPHSTTQRAAIPTPAAKGDG